MARLIAGVAAGNDFAEPLELKACGYIGERSRVDEYTVASLRFPGDILAQLSTGVQVHQDNVVRIYGSEGHIVIPSPWIISMDGGESRIIMKRDDAEAPEEIVVTAEKGLFAIEADTVAHYIDQRQVMPPAMTWDDSLGNMKTLDWWRKEIGLVYDMEKNL